MIVKEEVGLMQSQTHGWHQKLEAPGKICPHCLRRELGLPTPLSQTSVSKMEENKFLLS